MISSNILRCYQFLYENLEVIIGIYTNNLYHSNNQFQVQMEVFEGVKSRRREKKGARQKIARRREENLEEERELDEDFKVSTISRLLGDDEEIDGCALCEFVCQSKGGYLLFRTLCSQLHTTERMVGIHKGKVGEAIASYRKIIAINPKGDGDDFQIWVRSGISMLHLHHPGKGPFDCQLMNFFQNLVCFKEKSLLQ